MAIAVLDFNTNQWYVQHANGELEPCHNRATANHLARRANERANAAAIQREEEVQLVDYDYLYERGLTDVTEAV